jgi:hypothetical protein
MGRNAAMTTPGKLVNLAALAIATASSGCLYQREVVRDPPPPVAQSAPPPPGTEAPPPADDDASGAIAENQAVPPPGADVNDDRVFYERLAPYGHWEWVPEYGRVWVPAVAPGWRPYVYGRWVLTDWGWTWASDDPWGWAAYHYGSWGYTFGVGWFWLPGHVWAPAWVTWRWGFGYCAWAPIGPHGVFFGYRHPAWVAVRNEHFTQPISVHVVSVQQTSGIVQRATPLPVPRAAPARGGSFGPPVAQIAAATGRPVRAVNASVAVAPRSTTNSARPAMTNSPVRAQSPMQSPRGQPQTSTGTGSWRGSARSGGAGSWRMRQPMSNGSGAARAGSGARVSGGAPARGSAPAGGAARSAPGGGGGGAPRAAPSAPPPSGGGGGGGGRGGGGGGGGHSGGARASGGGSRR